MQGSTSYLITFNFLILLLLLLLLLLIFFFGQAGLVNAQNVEVSLALRSSLGGVCLYHLNIIYELNKRRRHNEFGKIQCTFIA